jgi:septum formation inhibitor MinC
VCGKVFAGIDGDETATIFIHSFNAQLIAIAGYPHHKIWQNLQLPALVR